MMTTVAYPKTFLSDSLIWMRNLLSEELSPYPGRSALVARMVFVASLVMVINMTFRVPFGAYGALYGLVLSRENSQATLQAAKTMIVSLCFGGVYVLLGAIIFSGDPALRLAWVLFTLFLMFFGLKVVSNYTAAVRFGYLLVITIPLWDRRITAEQKVVQTLWAVGAISFASAITAAIELVYARLHPTDTITLALIERLRCVSGYLRSWSEPLARLAAERQVMRLAILGTSRMRRDLVRSDYPLEVRQQLETVIAMVGRVVDLAANLRQFSSEISGAGLPRVDALASAIENLANDLSEKQIPRPPRAQVVSDTAAHVPILAEMERTVSLICEALPGSESPTGYYLAPVKQQPAKPFFVPDAFSNPDYIRFAIRGGLAASFCYLIYNLIDWQGISTSVTTCYLTALTTIGASRQKQILRFGGALVGGVILGFGAQIFVLPSLDSIGGFLVLFVVVSALAAWIATSGPRLSYFGVQIAVAFYLINLQEFKFQTSLAVARDRVAGILLGLIAMWVVFDQLWGASALVEMQRTFVSTLRSMAMLMRAPVSKEPSSAIGEILLLREKIGTGFESMRQHADGVMLEFGNTRGRDLASRSHLLRWQMRLTEMFGLRITLLKYRLHLPGFELPESAQKAQKAFDAHIAGRLDAMADWIAQKIRVGLVQEEFVASVDQTPEQDERLQFEGDVGSHTFRTFVPLLSRLESLASALERDIHPK